MSKRRYNRVMRGTLLNTTTVAVGASVGLIVGSNIPPEYQRTAMAGLGLVVIGIGVKLFLQSKNVLYVAGAIALGGVLGTALRIDPGLHNLTEWVRQRVGGGTHFNQGLITCAILFCVGPLTLLGCIKDGLEGDIELLGVKSTMDGFGAFFFAAALGRDGGFGVLLSALVVLIYQGALTLLARPLRPLADDSELFAEVSGSGGVMLMAIGLGLLAIKTMPVANYLPALVLAPLFVWIGRMFSRHKGSGKDLENAEI